VSFLPIHLLAHLVGEAHATEDGETIKEVKCEACGFEYVYQLQRSAGGRATGFLVGDYEAAADRARENLREILENACDPIPCPACGWYQRPMVRRVRQLRHCGMVHASILLLFFACLFFAAGSITSCAARQGEFSYAGAVLLGLAGMSFLIGLCLPVIRFVLCRLHDPNSGDVESRMRLGQARALNKKAYVSGIATPPPG